MEAREFVMSKGITINKGNYESVRLDATVTLFLNSGDTVERAGATARMLLNMELRRAAEETGLTDSKRFGI